MKNRERGDKNIPYNKGDAYEQKIFDIMKNRGLLLKGSNRAGAGAGTDIVFLHSGKKFKLEVKLDDKADYGQKGIKWSKERGWEWRRDDNQTMAYTQMGILDILNRKNMVPRRFTKPKEKITFEDKRSDQKMFEDRTIEIPDKALIEFYKIKKCFYIQVGRGFGFFHLDQDVANLGTQRFRAKMILRLRAKTHHSRKPYQYSFFATLKVGSIEGRSKFNLEESEDQQFPPIEP